MCIQTDIYKYIDIYVCLHTHVYRDLDGGRSGADGQAQRGRREGIEDENEHEGREPAPAGRK